MTLSRLGATESRARWRRARQTAIGSPQGEPSVRRERINRDDVIDGKLIAGVGAARDRRGLAAPHVVQARRGEAAEIPRVTNLSFTIESPKTDVLLGRRSSSIPFNAS